MPSQVVRFLAACGAFAGIACAQSSGLVFSGAGPANETVGIGGLADGSVFKTTIGFNVSVTTSGTDSTSRVVVLAAPVAPGGVPGAFIQISAPVALTNNAARLLAVLPRSVMQWALAGAGNVDALDILLGVGIVQGKGARTASHDMAFQWRPVRVLQPFARAGLGPYSEKLGLQAPAENAAIVAGSALALRWNSSGLDASSQAAAFLCAVRNDGTRGECFLLSGLVSAVSGSLPSVRLPATVPEGPCLLGVKVAYGRGFQSLAYTAGAADVFAYDTRAVTVTAAAGGSATAGFTPLAFTAPLAGTRLVTNQYVALSWLLPAAGGGNFTSASQATLSVMRNDGATYGYPSVAADLASFALTSTTASLTQQVLLPPALPTDGNYTLRLRVTSGPGAGVSVGSGVITLVPGFAVLASASLVGGIASTPAGELLQVMQPTVGSLVTAGGLVALSWRSKRLDASSRLQLSLLRLNASGLPVPGSAVVLATNVAALPLVGNTVYAESASYMYVRIPAMVYNGDTLLVATVSAGKGSNSAEGALQATLRVRVQGGVVAPVPRLTLRAPLSGSSLVPASFVVLRWDSDFVPFNTSLSIVVTNTGRPGWNHTIASPGAPANASDPRAPKLVSNAGLLQWQVPTSDSGAFPAMGGYVIAVTASVTIEGAVQTVGDKISSLTFLPSASLGGLLLTNSSNAVPAVAQQAQAVRLAWSGYNLQYDSAVLLALCNSDNVLPTADSMSGALLAAVGLRRSINTSGNNTGGDNCLYIRTLPSWYYTPPATLSLLQDVTLAWSVPPSSGYFFVAALVPAAGTAATNFNSGSALSSQIPASGSGRVTRSALFAVAAGAQASASLGVTAPAAPVTLGANEYLTVTWGSVGLPYTTRYTLVAVPAAGNPGANITIAVDVYAYSCVASTGACKGAVSWRVPTSAAGPAGGDPRSYVISVRPKGADSTAPVPAPALSSPVSVIVVVPAVISGVVVNSGAQQWTNGPAVVRTGVAFTLSWVQSSSVVGPYAVSLVPLYCAGFAAATLQTFNNGTVAPGPLGGFNATATVPETSAIPAACQSAAAFAVRITSGNAVVAQSSAVQVVPRTGSLRVTFPSAGAKYTTGSALSVRFESAGVAGLVSVAVMRVVNATGPVLDSTPLGMIASAIPVGAAYAAVTSVPAAWVTAAGTDGADGTVQVVVRVSALNSTDASAPVAADSGVLSVSLPTSKLTDVVATSSSNSASSATGAAVRTFEIGAAVSAAWKYTGYASYTKLNVGLTNSVLRPDGSFLWLAASGVATSQGQVTFTLPGSLATSPAAVASAYAVAVAVQGYSASSDAGTLVTTPAFSVAAPSNSLRVKSVTDLSSSSSTSTSPLVQGGRFSVAWEASGAAATNASYDITLLNRVGAAISVPLAFNQPSTGSITLSLPVDLDVSAYVGQSYYVQLTSSAGSGALSRSATSSLFSITAPRAFIRITAPAAGASFNPSSAAGTSSVGVVFDASTLPLQPTGAVSVTLRNRYNASLAIAIGTISAADGAASFDIPQDFLAPNPPSYVTQSYYVTVQSVDFPVISSSSGVFAIVPPAKTLCFTVQTDDGWVDCVAKTLRNGWAVFAETDSPLLTWTATGYSAGAGDRVFLRVSNAYTGEWRDVSNATNAPNVTDGSFAVPFGQLAGFRASQTAGYRDAFYVTARVATSATAVPSLQVSSPYFTVFARTSTVAALVKLSAPAQSTTTAAGSTLTVSWNSVGLPASATVSIELANDVLGAQASATLASNQPATGSASVTIPAGAAAASTVTLLSARSAWYIRVRASATVFAVSPLITVLPAGGSIQVSKPNSAVAVQPGQSLDIAWAAVSLSGTVDITLVNDQLTAPLAVASGVDASTGALTWTVPDTVSTAIAVSRSYAIRIASSVGTVSARSAQFTINAAESTLTVLTPASGDAFTTGGNMTISWAARNLQGPVAVSLFNRVLNSEVQLTSANVSDRATLPTADSTTGIVYSIPASVAGAAASAAAWFVRVKSVDSPTTIGLAGPFSIQALSAPITISAPAAGATMQAGSTIQVAFSLSADAAASADFSKLKISLRNRQSPTFELVLVAELSAATAAGTLLAYSIPSTVPCTQGIRDAYFVRVASVSNTQLTADSDPFTVTASASTLRVTAPASGITVSRGDGLLVTWEARNIDASATLRLELLNARMGLKLSLAEVAVAASATDSSGDDGSSSDITTSSATVRLPQSLVLPSTGRDGFAVRATLVSDSAVSDDSDLFTIAVPSRRLRVLAPVTGVTPESNSTLRVQWQAVNIQAGASVNVYFRNLTATSSASGDDALILAATAAVGDSSVAVTVPAGAATPNNQWTVRVRLSDDTDVFTDSSPFAIRAPAPPALEKPTVSSPGAGSTITTGDAVAISWTHRAGYSVPAGLGYRVEVRCFAACSGNVLVASAPTIVAASAGGISTLSLPPLALESFDVLRSCYIGLAGATLPGSAPVSGASSLLARSAYFSIKRAELAVSFSSPAGLSAPTMREAVGDARSLPVRASGSNLTVSWTYLFNHAAALPAGVSIAAIDVTLYRYSSAVGGVSIGSLYLARATGNASLPTTLATVVPGTLPFGTYYLALSALPAGWSRRIVAASAPFAVMPAFRNMSIVVGPATSTSLVAGNLLSVTYALGGVAASNHVRASIRRAGTAAANATLLAVTDATGILRHALPCHWPAGSYIVRLELVEDPTLAVETAPVAVSARSAYLTVAAPAAATPSALTWAAGDSVTVTFSQSGFAPGTTVNITLMQDRYLLGGGDRVLAILSAEQPIEQAAFTWVVPSNLPSYALVYVKIAANVASSAKPWARSAYFGLRSATPKGLKEWLDTVCTDVSAGTPAPYFPAALRSLCNVTCDACTASGGKWTTSANVSLDFKLPYWPGSLLARQYISNALGAMHSAGASLCLPASLVAAPSNLTANASSAGSAAGEYRFSLQSVPAVRNAIVELSAGWIRDATLAFTVSNAFSLVDTCTAILPVVQASVTVVTSSSNATAGSVTDAIANATGVSPSDITVVTVVPSLSSPTAPGSPRSPMRRRLQASGDASSAGDAGEVTFSVYISASDDATAQAASDVIAAGVGDAYSATGDAVAFSTSNAVAYTGSSLGSVDSCTGSIQIMFDGGDESTGDNRPLGGSDESVLSSSVFSDGTYTSLLAIAVNRDRGVAAVTVNSAGGGSGGASGPDNTASAASLNVGVVAGAVAGGVALIAVAVVVAVVVAKASTRSRRVYASPDANSAPSIHSAGAIQLSSLPADGGVPEPVRAVPSLDDPSVVESTTAALSRQLAYANSLRSMRRIAPAPMPDSAEVMKTAPPS